MDHQKLKGKLLEKQKTYAECAKALGISTVAFNNKMNEKTKFDIVEVNKLSSFLELTDKESVEIFLRRKEWKLKNFADLVQKQ